MTGSPASLLDRLIGGLIRFRLPIFFCSLVITGLAVIPATKLSFDQTVESMFAADDPHLVDYVNSKNWFGGDELVGAIYRDPALLTEEGLARIRKLADKLSKTPGVQPESTQDLAANLAAVDRPIFRTGFFRKYTRELRSQVIELFRGILIGDDDQTTAVVVRLAPENQAGVSRQDTINQIRDVAAKHQKETGFAVYVVGEPVQVHDMFRFVQDDGSVLGWVSTGLLIVVILVLFRNLRWVILPILVVQATLLWTKAVLVFWGIKLTMVSSILESLVTIIGVATVMHMSLVYCELRDEHDRFGALQRTLTMLAGDVFWVCATTAGGFAAELSSHVFPVRSFGVIMTLGSMLVLPAIAFLLPGGVLLGTYTADPNVSAVDKRLGRWLSVLGDWIERYPWRLLAGCLAITALSLVGVFRIRVETEFSRNFRESSPIVQAINFTEMHLGGAGAWEVNFPAPEGLSTEFLDRVRDFARQLRELPAAEAGAGQLTKVTAISDGIDLIPERMVGMSISLERRLELLRALQPEFVSSLYNPAAGRMRIVLRARERQSAEKKEALIRAVEERAAAAFPSKDPQQRPRATGLFVLLTFIVESLLGDQWACFLWGAAGIVAMMTVAYRSLRIGLISLFPNLLPIALVIGAMGWLDLPINIGTAMISSVSMGLTVDASIFYISSFRRMQVRGLDFSQALRATQHDIGRALIYSNAALVLGFLVLTLSHFVPLIYFGLLVSVAILGGLAGNLVMLPLLMRATSREARSL